MTPLDTLIAQDLPAVEAIRHDLHAHPELGYQETRTAKSVCSILQEAGIEFVADLAGGTGVLGYLPATENPENARTIALRADMDALPILEKTGKAYASTCPGVMHACGHDGHTAILLGTARTLSQLTHRTQNVLFIFQPAEEGGAGGKKMCENGVLQGTVLGPAADTIYGLHCAPFLALGEVASRVGPMMASTDDFKITVTGQGGHAAMPNVGVDPIVVAAHVVTSLQTVASRNVDPIESVVVTVGKIEAGSASNIIPHTCQLIGTVRTLSPEVRTHARERVTKLAEQISSAFNASAEVNWREGYPVTVNDANATATFMRIAAEVLGESQVSETTPTMGGEDFSFYGLEIPACFYWLGTKPEGAENYPSVHTPEFDFNDEALSIGIRMMCELSQKG